MKVISSLYLYVYMSWLLMKKMLLKISNFILNPQSWLNVNIIPLGANFSIFKIMMLNLVDGWRWGWRFYENIFFFNSTLFQQSRMDKKKIKNCNRVNHFNWRWLFFNVSILLSFQFFWIIRDFQKKILKIPSLAIQFLLKKNIYQFSFTIKKNQ